MMILLLSVPDACEPERGDPSRAFPTPKELLRGAAGSKDREEPLEDLPVPVLSASARACNPERDEPSRSFPALRLSGSMSLGEPLRLSAVSKDREEPLMEPSKDREEPLSEPLSEDFLASSLHRSRHCPPSAERSNAECWWCKSAVLRLARRCCVAASARETGGARGGARAAAAMLEAHPIQGDVFFRV